MDQIAEHELITIISGRSQKSLAGLLGVATATLQPLTRDSNVFIRTCLFVLPKEELSPTAIGEGLFNQLTEYTALQITSKEDKIAPPATSKEEAKADSHGHHDSLIAIDRLTINEILILKRRIAHYDIEGSKDLLGREIDHIHNRADMFSDGSDTTDTESPSNEVGLKLLYEEMKELKSSTKINKNRKIRQSSTGFC